MTFAQHPAAGLLKGLGAIGRAPVAPVEKKKPEVAEPVLDAAQLAERRAVAAINLSGLVLDAVTRADVAAALQQWAETAPADLGEGETMADRLFALCVGIADDNKDGELTNEEIAVVTTCLENAYDYLVGKGVSDDDATALLQDGSDEAAQRVAEFLKGALPEGEDGEMADVDSFAFDSESSESLFDAVLSEVFKDDPVLDAVYKKKLVVRGGRKLRINKRVSGRVVLSAAQKIAIRKARRKAHSSVARVHRAKSMKMRARSGL